MRTGSLWPWALPGALFHLLFVYLSSGFIEGRRYFTLFDDAMVSLAYGRTLAQTGEWVWFAGADRVQGISSPLWSLYMAGLHWLGLEGSWASLAVSLTGVAFLAVTAWVMGDVTRRMTRGLPGSDAASKAVVLVVSLCFPLAFWTLRGMEVGLVAMLGTLMLRQLSLLLPSPSSVTLQQDRRVLGRMALLLGLGVLARIDFAVAGGVLVCAAWWLMRLGGRTGLVWQLAILLPLPIAVAGLLVFQAVYWGDPLPNTYHLKIGGYPLGERLRAGVAAGVKSLPLLVLSSLAVGLLSRYVAGPARCLLAATFAVVVAMLGYSVWTGGDAWEYGPVLNRYVSSVLPFAAALIVAGLAVAGASLQGRERTALAVVLAGLVAWWPASGTSTWRWLGSVARDPGQGREFFAGNDLDMTARSRAIAGIVRPGGVVATVWAGAPGYYAGRHMVDLLGKSDRRVARSPPKGRFRPGHNKWLYAYAIGERRPEMVMGLWRPTRVDLRHMQDWGYVRLCHDVLGPAFYRAGSDRVEWSVLGPCPDGP
ncbi:MAG: hypothetical protein R3E94_12720 [Burkholderiaceae bacterium]